MTTEGYVPAVGRNLVAEKRARLDRGRRTVGRKSGDPRLDRQRALAITPDQTVFDTCDRCGRDNTGGLPHTVCARPGSAPCGGHAVPVTR